MDFELKDIVEHHPYFHSLASYASIALKLDLVTVATIAVVEVNQLKTTIAEEELDSSFVAAANGIAVL